MQTRFKLLLTSTVLLLLSGCTRHHSDEHPQVEEIIPDSKVIDFNVASCETLWVLDDNATLSNSLYWLRAMDCSARMTAAQANYQAALIPLSGWANIFKQSILTAEAEPDLNQRKILLNNVDNYREQMPGEIRPLVQLWHDRQSLQLALEDEKARNARQQSANEAKLADMINQQKILQASLDDTKLKLENLTDIERQLSSRKQLQGELPDSEGIPSGSGKGTSGSDAQTKDTYLPAKTGQSSQ